MPRNDGGFAISDLACGNFFGKAYYVLRTKEPICEGFTG